MAAGRAGVVPVVATPWGSDADRQDVPVTAQCLPRAMGTPVPHLYNLPLAVATALPGTADMHQNGCACLHLDTAHGIMRDGIAAYAQIFSFISFEKILLVR
eukprot:4349915-Pleurochrysis_carterae.AAC.1